MNSPFIFFLKNESNRRLTITRWALIILKLLLIPMLAIAQFPLWWVISVMLAVFSFIEYRAMKMIPSIIFSEAEIIFRGVLKKKYLWFDVENIILKDDLLTVDFRDNRIFQKEVNTSANETAFNRWCVNKLTVSNN